MDGGIDDALALIFGLRSPEIDIIGITAVSGNVPVDKATINALRVVELLDRPEVWVAKGRARPLTRKPLRAFSFHGRDGLGDSHLPLPRMRPTNKSALAAINETLSSTKKSGLSIVCTGPLTNLASLLTRFPEAKKGIEDVVLMGGAYGVTEYGVGNETPVAEFNIYSDPEAAKLVFDSGLPLRAVGLDVTGIPRLELGREDYTWIRRKKTDVARFVTRILEKNMQMHKRFALHDPMAVAVKIRPTLYKFSNFRVRVETRGEYTTGMTVADKRSLLKEDQLLGRPVSVCRDVDPGFKRLFLERVGAE